MMKTIKKRLLLATICLLSMCFLPACVYSFEELDAIQRYEKQGKKNAKAYIEEKYGFTAKVQETKCEYLVGNFDFSPPPSGDVYVSMEYGGREFVVEIPGDEVTTEGSDNYQLEEIRVAMEQALCELTGVSAENVFLFYGYYWDFADVNMGHNGLIPMYFDGTNLVEVLDGYAPMVRAVYVQQDITDVDMGAIRESLKVDDCELVNYNSREYYNFLRDKYNGSSGVASVDTAEENMPYVQDYWSLYGDEITYVEPCLTIIDGILVYTENPEAQVSLEKEKIDEQTELILRWYEKSNLKEGAIPDAGEEETRLLDTYIIRSDADSVFVFIPVEIWADVEAEFDEIECIFGGPTGTLYYQWDYTEDGKYVGAKIYFLSYDYVSFRVIGI